MLIYIFDIIFLYVRADRFFVVHRLNVCYRNDWQAALFSPSTKLGIFFFKTKVRIWQKQNIISIDRVKEYVVKPNKYGRFVK